MIDGGAAKRGLEPAGKLRRVFIFGAGASMAYRGAKGSLFLDRDFFNVVEREVWASWCDGGRPWKGTSFQPLPDDHAGTPWQWPPLKQHIERLAGKAIEDVGMEDAFELLSDGSPEMFASLCRALELALFWRLRGLKPEVVPTHVEFLRRTLAPGDTILTFNYDPLVEIALPMGVQWDPSTGYGLKFTAELSPLDAVSAPVPERASNVTLLKLHGSMNWLIPAIAGVSERLYLFRMDGTSVRGVGWKLHRGSDDEALRPLFVPPEPGKDYERYGLALLWDHARDALRSAEEVFIVGYSFPRTDRPALAMVRDSTLHLRESSHVHFVTRAAASEATRQYRTLFPAGLVHEEGFAAFVSRLRSNDVPPGAIPPNPATAGS